MSLNQVYLNLQKQHQPSVFIMTNIDKRIMTLWVGFLNSKVTRQHTAHLLNSCADPGHVGSNVHVDVKHIFLCNISLRRRCTMTWEMFTFPHWNAPAELTRPTKVPSSVVKAPPLSPCRVLMKLGNFLIGDHFSQYKWVIYTKTSVFVLSFWQITSFVATRAELIKANSIENTWQVPFPLPPAQTVFASKTSPFSSTFFLQALLVAIGTWCGSTWVNRVFD